MISPAKGNATRLRYRYSITFQTGNPCYSMFTITFLFWGHFWVHAIQRVTSTQECGRDPHRVSDEVLRWHFRQNVLANMRGAGEPVFEHDLVGKR
ncbi:hypothetical protein BGX38DRAFT_1218585 [Terfezia claveryi]|nr:hypothetical protein BGX38DRAFT_1218585 [Terfezia claveryi]